MNDMDSIPAHVIPVFQKVPFPTRQTLLDVRALIFEVAASDPRIGEIEETLRWGDPAYITTKARTGSTIRVGIEKKSGRPAVFFNCKTTLVEEFRQQYGETLGYSKNRAILLADDINGLSDTLKSCIAAALTYHLSN